MPAPLALSGPETCPPRREKDRMANRGTADIARQISIRGKY